MKSLFIILLFIIIFISACSSKSIQINEDKYALPENVNITNVNTSIGQDALLDDGEKEFKDVVLSSIKINYKDLNYEMSYDVITCVSCDTYRLISFCENSYGDKQYFANMGTSKVTSASIIVPNPRTRLNLTEGKLLRCGVAVFDCQYIKTALNIESCPLKSADYSQFNPVKEFVGEITI